MALTETEQAKADAKAAEAAKREWENDPNRKDPDGVQARMDAAVKRLSKA
jgi:hypothetical protein